MRDEQKLDFEQGWWMLFAFLFVGMSVMVAKGRRISPWRAHAEGRKMRERIFGCVHVFGIFCKLSRGNVFDQKAR